MQGKFSVIPSVFVTAAHYRAGLKRDDASVWIEDVTQSSFKICLRELQNYAGCHEDVYTVSVYTFFMYQPPAKYNNAYCKVGIFFVLLASLPGISFSKISRVSLQILQNNVNLNNHSLSIGYYKI